MARVTPVIVAAHAAIAVVYGRLPEAEWGRPETDTDGWLVRTLIHFCYGSMPK